MKKTLSVCVATRLRRAGRHARWLVAALAISLAACAQTPPPATPIAVPAKPVTFPAECTAPDAAWQSLPDRDVKRSELVRNYAANRAAYARILARRSVCRAAHSAAARP